MFLKKSVIRGTAYYALAESSWDAKRHLAKTVYFRRLGKLNEIEALRWKIILSHPAQEVPKELVNVENIRCYRTWRHGIPCLAHLMWKNLGFGSIISESLSRVHNKALVSKLIEAMVVDRLENPCSKLKLLEWIQEETSLQFLADIPDIKTENSFYRAMDILWKRRDLIERKIYTRIVKPRSKGDMIGKDITSTYFEGTESPLGKKGYSRDHRPDLLQMNWSLIETEEGYPITLEVYNGNVIDKTTVEASVERLRTLFEITEYDNNSKMRLIFVVDRGMATEKNVSSVRESGMSFIIAELLSKNLVRSKIEEALKHDFSSWNVIREKEEDEEQQLFQNISEDNVLRFFDIDSSSTATLDQDQEQSSNNDRFIIFYNSLKARNDIAELEKNIAKGKEIISKVEKYARKNPEKLESEDLAAKVVSMVSRRLEKAKISEYFEIKSYDAKESSKLIYELKEKTEYDRRYAGIWVLRTDVTKDRKSAQEILKLYKSLSVIERTFRNIKSSLDLRPMWHRNEDRVKAHIWICVIAYLVERIVEDEVRRRIPEITAERIFDLFRNVMLSEQGFDDPVTKGPQMKWWVTTDLNEKNISILNALELKKESFAMSRGLVY